MDDLEKIMLLIPAIIATCLIAFGIYITLTANTIVVEGEIVEVERFDYDHLRGSYKLRLVFDNGDEYIVGIGPRDSYDLTVHSTMIIALSTNGLRDDWYIVNIVKIPVEENT